MRGEGDGTTGDPERYETILSNIRDAVYTLDSRGRITWVNEVAIDAFDGGYGRDELVGSSVEKLLEPADIEKCLECIGTLLSSDRDSIRQEVELLTADGEKIPVELHLTLLPFEDGEFRGTIGVARDITERKRRKQRLAVLNRVLRHNLRNDVNVIAGYADRLKNADGLGRSERDEIETIRETAADLARLGEKARYLNEFLESEDPATYPLDVVERCEVACDRYENRRAGVTIDRSFPDEALVLAGDHVDVAIDNVLENAIDHAGSEGPTIRVDVSSASDWESVDVTIADDGPGIPDGEIAALERDEEMPLEHGSGIGLWLITWIVESYSGTVTFSESETGGTAVTLTLPAA